MSSDIKYRKHTNIDVPGVIKVTTVYVPIAEIYAVIADIQIFFRRNELDERSPEI